MPAAAKSIVKGERRPPVSRGIFRRHRRSRCDRRRSRLHIVSETPMDRELRAVPPAVTGPGHFLGRMGDGSCHRSFTFFLTVMVRYEFGVRGPGHTYRNGGENGYRRSCNLDTFHNILSPDIDVAPNGADRQSNGGSGGFAIHSRGFYGHLRIRRTAGARVIAPDITSRVRRAPGRQATPTSGDALRSRPER